jgi:hypothetical protein
MNARIPKYYTYLDRSFFCESSDITFNIIHTTKCSEIQLWTTHTLVNFTPAQAKSWENRSFLSATNMTSITHIVITEVTLCWHNYYPAITTPVISRSKDENNSYKVESLSQRSLGFQSLISSLSQILFVSQTRTGEIPWKHCFDV